MTNLEKLYELDKELIKARNKIYFAEMLDEIKAAFIEIHRIRIEIHEVLKKAKYDPELQTIKGVKGQMEVDINEAVNNGKVKAKKIYAPEFYTRTKLHEIVDMDV